MRQILTTFGLLLPLAAAACGFTTEGNAARELIKTATAQASDEGLVNAEWFICNAAPVGAILRRYGRSKDAAAGWRALCLGDPEAQLVIAPSEENYPNL